MEKIFISLKRVEELQKIFRRNVTYDTIKNYKKLLSEKDRIHCNCSSHDFS